MRSYKCSSKRGGSEKEEKEKRRRETQGRGTRGGMNKEKKEYMRWRYKDCAYECTWDKHMGAYTSSTYVLAYIHHQLF